MLQADTITIDRLFPSAPSRVEVVPRRKKKVAIVALYALENSGVRHITSILKHHGWAAHLLFFKQWYNNRVPNPTEREIELLCELVVREQYDVIGLSFGSPYWLIAREVTERIRAVKSDALIVWGGLHVTLSPETCMPYADVLCVGEGEYPFMELMERLERGEDYYDVPNLWIHKGDEVIKNEVQPLHNSLDELPFRDLGGEDKYFIDYDKVTMHDPELDNREFRVHASRGCPYRCAYCYNSSLAEVYPTGNYQRLRSVGDVIEEIKHARGIMKNMTRVKFDDDTFVFPREWLEEFCERYPVEVGLPFYILLTPQAAKEGNLAMLKKAGLKHIQMGIQSASEDEAKEVFGRTSTNAEVTRFAKMNRRLKIQITYDLIVDDPLATSRDKETLYTFLMGLPGPYRLFLYSLTLFPRSAVASTFIDRGISTPLDVEGYATKSFRQFRVSLDYPRSKEDRFYLALIVLITKEFVPRSFIRACHDSEFFRENPDILLRLSQAANLVKMAQIAAEWGMRGELSLFKIREYGSLSRMITQ